MPLPLFELLLVGVVAILAYLMRERVALWPRWGRLLLAAGLLGLLGHALFMLAAGSAAQ